MKRSSKFIIMLVTAAITFGSLVAVLGPKEWGHYEHHRWYHEHHHGQNTPENNSN